MPVTVGSQLGQVLKKVSLELPSSVYPRCFEASVPFKQNERPADASSQMWLHAGITWRTLKNAEAAP